VSARGSQGENPLKSARHGAGHGLIDCNMRHVRAIIAVSLMVAATGLALEGEAIAMKLESSAFTNEGMVPAKYTCDGNDVSPPLTWSGVPGGTKSLALIADDPDAPMGEWVHWVVWNIPPSITALTENISADRRLDDGMRQGINDFKRAGYGGPCPPGGTHRYYFKLYALDADINLGERAGKSELENAMKGHVLAEAQLMGRYARK